jgi:hypothetical protein
VKTTLAEEVEGIRRGRFCPGKLELAAKLIEDLSTPPR